MLALILLLQQVSWLDPIENMIDEQVNAIQPIEIRVCVRSRTSPFMDTARITLQPEPPAPQARLELMTEFSKNVKDWRAACERAEILRRVTELEILVRQLIADRGR